MSSYSLQENVEIDPADFVLQDTVVTDVGSVEYAAPVDVEAEVVAAADGEQIVVAAVVAAAAAAALRSRLAVVKARPKNQYCQGYCDCASSSSAGVLGPSRGMYIVYIGTTAQPGIKTVRCWNSQPITKEKWGNESVFESEWPID